MKQVMHPEVANIETTLEAMQAGDFEVPRTPGVTAMVQLVFYVPYMGKTAGSKYCVSRELMEDMPNWKQVIGRAVASNIRDLEVPPVMADLTLDGRVLGALTRTTIECSDPDELDA